jgi:hypothetical protein
VGERVISFRVRLKDDGTVAGIERIGKEFRELDSNVKGIERSLGSAATAVKTFIGAYAIREVIRGGAALVEQGIQYNAQLEQSRLGIASLVAGFSDLQNANGQRVEGEAKWQAALAISEEMQDRLRVKALKTTAEYGELVDALQSAVGPAIQAAFSPEQIVDFTTAVAQSAAAIGVPMNQLNQEIRALFSGDVGPDSRLATLFFKQDGIENVKKHVEELKALGKFYDVMMEKMATFTRAGEEAGDTFNGAMSNLRDAISQALGEATQSQTGSMTEQIKALTSAIVQFDQDGKPIFDESFVSGVRALGDAFVYVAEATVDVVKALPDIQQELKYFYANVKQELKELYTNPLNTIAPIGLFNTIRGGMDAYERTQAQLAWDASQQFGQSRYEANLERIRLHSYGERTYPNEFGPPKPRPGFVPGGGGSATTEAERKKLEAEQKRLRDLQDDYLDFVTDFRAKANAAGDPLGEALAGIASQRAKAIDRLEDFQEKLKGVVGVDFTEAKESIDTFFAHQEQEQLDKFLQDALEQGSSLSELMEPLKEADRELAEYRLETQAWLEDERISLIEDSVEREFEARQAELERWYAAEKKAIQENEKFTADQKRQALALLKQQYDAQQRMLKEEVKKEKDIIVRTLGEISTEVQNLAATNVSMMQGLLNSFFQGVVDGSFDAGETLVDFGQQMGDIWANLLSNMVTRAMSTSETIAGQWKKIGESMDDSMLDAGMGGLGIGAMIGGLGSAIMGPQTYAAEGGMIGGIVGGIVGFFAGGNVQLGAVIGGAIGTALGGMIQKGKDEIRVNIVRGLVEVDEKGLSAEGARDLERDIQRQVDDHIKSWNNILELFPKEIAERIRGMVSPLTFSGGVEEADIKDSTALNALGDFLSDELPEAIFDRYQFAIAAGLDAMGISAERIKQEMEYWGTLQGKELQEAVRRYVAATVESARLRDLFRGDAVQMARDDAAKTPADRLRDFGGVLADMVDSLTELDLEDQLSMQEQINQASADLFANIITALQQIDEIQRSIHDSIGGQLEQLELAGMDDQEKMNYFYDRMFELRQQLMNETDPTKIRDIVAQIQAYASQAMSLDPENEENRIKLMDILRDILGISDTQLEEARDEVVDVQMQAAQALQAAGVTLADAAIAIRDSIAGVPGATPGQPEGGGGDAPPPRNDDADTAPNLDEEWRDFTDGMAKVTTSAGEASEELAELAVNLRRLGEFGLDGGVDGSHAAGLPYVPFDGYVARLHRGERVLTAAQNARGGASTSSRRFDINVNLGGSVGGSGMSDAQARQIQRSLASQVLRHLRMNESALESRHD